MSEKKEWIFEESARARRSVENVRTREGALKSIDVLFDHLETKDADRQILMNNDGTRNLLIRWCMDFPLNIQWYESKLRRETGIQKRMVALVVVSGVLALAIAGFAAVQGFGGNTADAKNLVAELGVLLAAMFGVLQLMASSVDVKARVAGFWNASCDLQEALYTFVENWRGKPLSEAGAPSRDFVGAIHLELRLARKVARTERTSYFNTMRSPTDLVTVATGAVEVLRVRSKEALMTAETSPERVREAAAAKQISELMSKVAEAKADVDAAQFKLANVTDAQKADAEKALIEAKAKLVRAQSMLTAAVKADALNPV